MPLMIHPLPVPLRVDEAGAVRVAESRILLDIVVNAYKIGDSPEEIVNHFPMLRLADVYVVIGYYLHNRAEVDTFLCENIGAAEELRRKVETRQGSQEGLRERLLARYEGMSHAAPARRREL